MADNKVYRVLDSSETRVGDQKIKCIIFDLVRPYLSKRYIPFAKGSSRIDHSISKILAVS